MCIELGKRSSTIDPNGQGRWLRQIVMQRYTLMKPMFSINTHSSLGKQVSNYAKFGSIHVRNQSTHRGASGRETYSRAFRITLMLFYMQRLKN